MLFLIYYLFDCLTSEYIYLPSSGRYFNMHVSMNLKANELREASPC
jgi:hypothetical protein